MTVEDCPRVGESEAAEIDHHAYSIAQSWFKEFQPEALSYHGVNIGHILRASILLQVSRLARQAYYPDAYARDMVLLKQATSLSTSKKKRRSRASHFLAEHLRPLSQLCSNPFVTAKVRYDIRRHDGGRLRVLARDAPRTAPILQQLASDPGILLLLGAGKTTPPVGSVKCAIPPGKLPQEKDVMKVLGCVRGGLSNAGLPPDDLAMASIGSSAAREMGKIVALDQCFALANPDAVLLHDDTSPDGIHFAMLARNYEIPSITVQHGLDCEHFFLDEIYADIKCVWGPERRRRYISHADPAPGSIRVTGNPAYDGLAAPENLNTGGHYWLWLTRPHIPEKCFLPSRFVHEGVAILESLIECVRRTPTAKLLIKPHPRDYGDLYRSIVADSGTQDRVHVTDAPAPELIGNASLVISEDSTTALDAMFQGKPLVHAHFAPSRPVLPLSSYGAACFGSCSESLQEAIAAAQNLTADAQARMAAGQQRFIAEAAGPRDGMALDRICEIVHSTADSK